MAVCVTLRVILAGLLCAGLTACGVMLPYMFGYPDPPDVRIKSAEISPNGQSLVVGFSYRNGPGQLAVVPLISNKSDLLLLRTPPGLSWSDPTWSPDGDFLAAVSRCLVTDCNEGASGYMIWRMRADGSDLELMAPAGPRPAGWANVREDPVFGSDAEEIFYVEGEPPPPLLPDSLCFSSGQAVPCTTEHAVSRAIAPLPQESAPRSIIRLRDGVEEEVFPASIEGLAFSEITTNASLVGDRWLLVGHIHTSSTHPEAAGMESSRLRFATSLVRIAGEEVEREKRFEVLAAHASRKEDAYVFLAHTYEDGERYYRIYLSQQDEERLLVERRGIGVRDVSISDDLKHVVFVSQRYYSDPTFVWHYEVEKDALRHLRLLERLTEAVSEEAR